MGSKKMKIQASVIEEHTTEATILVPAPLLEIQSVDLDRNPTGNVKVRVEAHGTEFRLKTDGLGKAKFRLPERSVKLYFDGVESPSS